MSCENYCPEIDNMDDDDFEEFNNSFNFPEKLSMFKYKYNGNEQPRNQKNHKSIQSKEGERKKELPREIKV